jgi:glycosyltransferase involved in cell wall biosynthesis
MDGGERLQVTVVLELRFQRAPDGHVYAQAGFGPSFWQRYLTTFDHVNVVARVEDVAEAPDDEERSDCPGVSFDALPSYVGPLGFVLRYPKLARRLTRSASRDGALIFRVPSQLANTAVRGVRGTGKPYGLEVIGNPRDVFASGAVRHPLAPFFRRHFTRQLRRQCREAAAVAYVTQRTLQRSFPASPGRFTTHYSSIRLPEDWLRQAPRSYVSAIDRPAIVCIGSMSTHYKGQDVLLRAVKACLDRGVDVRAVLVGEGACRAEFEQLARTLGIDDRIVFAGKVAHGGPILKQLDGADLCVMPSRTEGLPRVLIEAMARGLPCIASDIGGIPELLDAGELVPPGDAAVLAERICAIRQYPQRLTELSARNLTKAREYVEPVLDRRRREFYGVVRDETRRWA